MKSCYMRFAALAAFACMIAPAGAAEGDAVAGKAVFQRTCQNCHAVEIGVNKIGPSLWNVVGRQPASVPDYAYSEGMKANKSPGQPRRSMPISPIRAATFTASKCSSKAFRTPRIVPT